MGVVFGFLFFIGPEYPCRVPRLQTRHKPQIQHFKPYAANPTPEILNPETNIWLYWGLKFRVQGLGYMGLGFGGLVFSCLGLSVSGCRFRV